MVYARDSNAQIAPAILVPSRRRHRRRSEHVPAVDPYPSVLIIWMINIFRKKQKLTFFMHTIRNRFKVRAAYAGRPHKVPCPMLVPAALSL